MLFLCLTCIKADNYRFTHALQKSFITFALVLPVRVFCPSDLLFNYKICTNQKIKSAVF